MTIGDARGVVLDALRRELVGPMEGERRVGVPLHLSGSLRFQTREEYGQRWFDAATGEEILRDVEPLRRYGVGVLHPRAGRDENELGGGVQGLPTDDELRDAPTDLKVDVSRVAGVIVDEDGFDVSDANDFQPSAMAVSFQVPTRGDGRFLVEASYARYSPIAVDVGTWSTKMWVRRPVKFRAALALNKLQPGPRVYELDAEVVEGEDFHVAKIRAYVRPSTFQDARHSRMITVVMENHCGEPGSRGAIFQCAMSVIAVGELEIEAYPEIPLGEDVAEEEASIGLLYRHKRTCAIGHGCAADWQQDPDGIVRKVSAEPLPTFELPSLTPDIHLDGKPLQVSMAALARGETDGDDQLQLVISAYGAWIEDKKESVTSLPDRYLEAAKRHIQLCEEALFRMQAGFKLLSSSPLARRAFMLANDAMASQQARSAIEKRPARLSDDMRILIEGDHPSVVAVEGRGNWRAFQIAFILACLPELVDPEHEKRELVDLIFFPTGGGKTEAYLGAAAISILARRLRDPADAGTEVLMRYTLRLLTAQQFLRAATLICVLEDIRTRNSDLGDARFNIGIWLGASTTPNSWDSAVKNLAALHRGDYAENLFLLLRCPWCAAEFGVIRGGKGGKRVAVSGYVRRGAKVRFSCPDLKCRFARGEDLPVHVVDEAIYEERPSLVIGTVDKFAMLAWRPRARSIFGIEPDGGRSVSPPGLIIQDELHLISGPLGSMVGLYEPVIESLCTDNRRGAQRKPKIVASTATIRRYEKQVSDLYGRSEVRLFPPHGFEEGSSFFAETAVYQDGSPRPGRMYVGVLSPSLGSIQTVQVRVAAATLLAGNQLSEGERDGYWTNLNFFNSLRELGNTVSLLQSDIPDYLIGVRKREGLESDDIRWPREVMELTSRIRSDEVTNAIERLQRPQGEAGCVDICLASNIIEVGVDIDRLSLMTIVGQPKTTSQYIQVSGRVGRRWWERPGLVVTIYGAAKPRDRSHYERFRTYHERLYAAVEPTSVTPFALPVLMRGLHGAVISHMRQTERESLAPDPFPSQSFAASVQLLRARAAMVDSEELPSFDKVADRRRREWEHGERTEWDATPLYGNPEQGLMRFAGTAGEPGSVPAMVWDVPSSMRSVDAECEIRVTTAYAEENIERDRGVQYGTD